jgi:hypothetical protein
MIFDAVDSLSPTKSQQVEPMDYLKYQVIMWVVAQ